MLNQVKDLLAERQVARAAKSVSSLNQKQTEGFGRAASAADLSGRLIVVEKGTILDAVPYLRLYRVALLRGPVITCTYGTDSTFQPFGVTSATVIPPGTTVLVVRAPSDNHGIIISAVPDFVKTYGDSPADELVAGANAGFFGDLNQKAVMHYQPPAGGGILAWKDNLVDALPGDWVKFSRLGSALFLTDFLSGFRVNEYCGIWMNYLDSLLRIAALNHQVWTAGSEEYSMLFWKAFLKYSGYGFTIRSQLGAKNEVRYSNPFISVTEDQYENPDVRASNIEPVTLVRGETSLYSRFPVHRVQEWGGVLGQGGMKWVVNSTNTGGPFPIPSAQDGTIANGVRIIQSRSGILLAKYPYISAPLRASDPDENYGKPDPATFDGELGTFLTKSNAFAFTGRLGLVRTMHILDIHNLLCNWEAQVGFYLLPKKFKFLKESELYNYFKQGLYSPAGSNSFSPAFIYLDNFGDILIQNGQGATIELKGGKIRISAPEGVHIDTGGELITFGKTVKTIAEAKMYLTSGERITMNVPADAHTEDPPTSGTTQEREDLAKINQYKDKDQMFVLSNDGNHQITGCVQADYISVSMQRVGLCTTVVAGGSYVPGSPVTILEPVPWLYQVFAAKKMNQFQPSKFLIASPTSYKFPATVDANGIARTPADMMAEPTFTQVIGTFPVTGTPQDMGFTNGILVLA